MRSKAAIAAAILALTTAAGAVWLWPSGGTERLSCNLADLPSAYPGMVWVPGGTLDMGGDVYPEESPHRTVPVDGFWMDRTEVTNAQFAEFVAATGYVTVAERAVDPAKHPGADASPGAAVFTVPAAGASIRDIASWWRYTHGANWRHPGGPNTDIQGKEQFPVSVLAYEDAQAYAKWKGRALPGEAQWEWASRGGETGPQDPHRPPQEANTWQGVFPVINTNEDGFAGLAPVGCYKPNAYGLHDMMGNVWEWTADAYQSGPRSPVPQRTIKGGSFLCAANYCMRYRSAARQGQEEDLAASHLGFRTILIAPGP